MLPELSESTAVVTAYIAAYQWFSENDTIVVIHDCDARS